MDRSAAALCYTSAFELHPGWESLVSMVSSGNDSNGVTSAASKRLFDALAHDAGRQGWQHTLAVGTSALC